MIYRISNKPGSLYELNNIKKIRSEYSNNIRVSSSEDQDSDYSLASDSRRYKDRRPDGRKEINNLYHVVTDNLNNYNNQSNEAIDNESTYDNSSFRLSSGTSDP